MRLTGMPAFFLVPLVALLLTLVPKYAMAQGPITLSSFDMSIWPEYDRPGVLVIYRGQFSPDVALPAQLLLTIPASAGGPSSTACVDAEGSYRYRSYQTVDQGDQTGVSYACPFNAFQLEYYDDPFSGQGFDRSFEYSYKLDYATDSLKIDVQQPLTATNFEIEPAADTTRTAGGLVHHLYDLGPQPAGQVITLKISYHNEASKLSGDILAIPTPAQVAFEDVAGVAGGGADGVSVPLVVAVTALSTGLLGFVGWAIWSQQSTKRGRRAMRRRAEMRAQLKPAGKRRQKQSARAAASAGGDESTRAPSTGRSESAQVPSAAGAGVTGYCHQCGRALREDEAFCASCGTRRKKV